MDGGSLHKLGVLQVVKEFYANLEERVDDKVFVRGKWVKISSVVINNPIRTPEQEEDDNLVLMEECLDTIELVEKLYQIEKEVILATGKNN